jgi:PTS system glucitol/sorbitol-specific IIA component
MNDKKLWTTVVEVGDSARSFLSEKMIIFFNKQATGDLREYSVLLDDLEGDMTIEIGDMFLLNEKAYGVTAVGGIANKNFQQLGHIVVRFDGETSALLPGEIHVEDMEIAEIDIGTFVAFEKK